MPTSTLSRTQQRRKDAVEADLKLVQEVGTSLSLDIFTRLLTRAGIPVTPDGYPTSSRLGMGRGGGENTPTESAVLAREKPRKDELSDVVKLIEYSIREAVHHLLAAEDAMSYTTSVETEFSERETSTPCGVCLINPVVKAGWCLQCHVEWEEHGRPDRLAWQHWKQEKVNSEGLVLVAGCPKPGDGCRASRGPYSGRAAEAA